MKKKQSKDNQKSKRLYKTYGITLEDWKRMYKKQKGVCWICQKLPKSKVLCIDHIHVKGYKKMKPEEKAKYVRSLICFSCNTVFGRFERRSNPRWLLERVVEYFRIFSMKGD